MTKAKQPRKAKEPDTLCVQGPNFGHPDWPPPPASYTPGPWKVTVTGWGEAILEAVGPDGEKDAVACVPRLMGALYARLDGQRANARRIVACVNACEGLDTLTLERVRVADLFATLARGDA